MPESPANEPGPKVDEADNSFPSKAARYSLIAPTVCWFVLLLFIFSNWDIYGAAWVFTALFLVAVSSFFAGFAGLYAPRKQEVIMGILGILISGSFGFFDFLALAFSGLGHNC